MKGKRIRTVKELCKAALERKAVIGNSRCFSAPMPAAFLVSMQARVVQRRIDDGLWVYQKPKRLPFHKAVKRYVPTR